MIWIGITVNGLHVRLSSDVERNFCVSIILLIGVFRILREQVFASQGH